MRRKLPTAASRWADVRPFFAVGHTWALDLTFTVNAQGFTFAMQGIIAGGSHSLDMRQPAARKGFRTGWRSQISVPQVGAGGEFMWKGQ